VILGRDFLQAIGLKNMDYKHDCMRWLDTIVVMKNIKQFENLSNVADIGFQPNDSIYLNNLLRQHQMFNYDSDEDEWLCDDAWESFSVTIIRT
jgi:precorrin-2 methylase